MAQLEADNRKINADNQRALQHVSSLRGIQKTLAKVTTIVSNLQTDTRDLVSANRGRPIARTLDGLIEVVNQMNHDVVQLQEMSAKGEAVTHLVLGFSSQSCSNRRVFLRNKCQNKISNQCEARHAYVYIPNFLVLWWCSRKYMHCISD